MDKLVIAISGASGVIYGVKVLEALHRLNVETLLVISKNARHILRHEMGLAFEEVAKMATTYYEEDDLFAPIASGSYVVNIKAMGIVPCSMKTVSAIASGYSNNLITRAADVMIKEKRRLVVLPRETPLSTIHLKNMLTLAQSGVVVLPPIPSFYDKPQTLADIIQQTVGRFLDHLGIISDIPKRWGGEKNG